MDFPSEHSKLAHRLSLTAFQSKSKGQKGQKNQYQVAMLGLLVKAQAFIKPLICLSQKCSARLAAQRPCWIWVVA